MARSTYLAAVYLLAWANGAQADDLTPRLEEIATPPGEVLPAAGTCPAPAVAVPVTKDGGGDHYRVDDGSWKIAPTVPGAARIEDVALFRGKLYAAIATASGGAVAVSTDGGGSWKPVSTLAGVRPHTFLEVGGALYLSASGNRFFGWMGSGFDPVDDDFFPTIRKDRASLFVIRSAHFGGQTLYLAARPAPGGGWASAGLFAAGSTDRLRELRISGQTPRDLLVKGKKLYLLTSSEEKPPDLDPAKNAAKPPVSADGGAPLAVERSAPEIWISVFASTNLVIWEETLSFRARAPPRALQLFKGDFYFALECAGGQPIVRIEAKHWQTGGPGTWIY